MKSAILFVAAFCLSWAISTSESVYATEETAIPSVDQLIQSFAESTQLALAHAKEYSSGDANREAYLIKMNTMTPDQLREVATFTRNNLLRQVEICHGLKNKFPKTKDVDCGIAVSMVNGLGHPDDQRQMMESMQDKQTVTKMLEALKGRDQRGEYKARMEMMKIGVGGDWRGIQIREDDLTQAIGYVSSIDQVQEALVAQLH